MPDADVLLRRRSALLISFAARYAYFIFDMMRCHCRLPPFSPDFAAATLISMAGFSMAYLQAGDDAHAAAIAAFSPLSLIAISLPLRHGARCATL